MFAKDLINKISLIRVKGNNATMAEKLFTDFITKRTIDTTKIAGQQFFHL